MPVNAEQTEVAGGFSAYLVICQNCYLLKPTPRYLSSYHAVSALAPLWENMGHNHFPFHFPADVSLFIHCIYKSDTSPPKHS